MDTLREILEKFLQPAPLLVGEVDTVEPSGWSEGDVSRERNRVAPEVTEPTSDKDTKLLIYGLFQKGRVLAQDGGFVECRERLGGLLRYYYRAAA